MSFTYLYNPLLRKKPGWSIRTAIATYVPCFGYLLQVSPKDSVFQQLCLLQFSYERPSVFSDIMIGIQGSLKYGAYQAVLSGKGLVIKKGCYPWKERLTFWAISHRTTTRGLHSHFADLWIICLIGTAYQMFFWSELFH